MATFMVFIIISSNPCAAFISVSFLGTVFYHPYKASLDMKVHSLKLKSKELNEYIDTIRSRCYALESEMLSLKLHLTVDTFVNAFRNGIKLNTIKQRFLIMKTCIK